jgi:hypothetical protein
MATMKKLIAAALIAALALPGGPLAAQADDAKPQTVGPPAFGPAAPAAKKCKSSDPRRPNEIIVCGSQDDKEFRVKSSAALDPDGAAATDDGQPHAPDFAESCKKNPGGACVKFGTTPEPAYMIKFEELPDTPEGSDADKIAKGEKKSD